MATKKINLHIQNAKLQRELRIAYKTISQLENVIGLKEIEINRFQYIRNLDNELTVDRLDTILKTKIRVVSGPNPDHSDTIINS
jgi:hypothetical protein